MVQWRVMLAWTRISSAYKAIHRLRWRTKVLLFSLFNYKQERVTFRLGSFLLADEWYNSPSQEVGEDFEYF